jgi:hypothetical protein
MTSGQEMAAAGGLWLVEPDAEPAAVVTEVRARRIRALEVPPEVAEQTRFDLDGATGVRLPQRRREEGLQVQRRRPAGEGDAQRRRVLRQRAPKDLEGVDQPHHTTSR